MDGSDLSCPRDHIDRLEIEIYGRWTMTVNVFPSAATSYIVSARFDRRTTNHYSKTLSTSYDIRNYYSRVQYYIYKKALNPIHHKFNFYKLFYSMTSMEETTPTTTTTTATTTDHSSEGKPISDAWNERYWYQCESFSKLTFDTFVLLLLHFPFLICFLY